MTLAAFLVVQISVTTLEVFYLAVHAFTYFICIAEQCLLFGFKEIHIVCPYHVNLHGLTQIKLVLQFLEHPANVLNDISNQRFVKNLSVDSFVQSAKVFKMFNEEFGPCLLTTSESLSNLPPRFSNTALIVGPLRKPPGPPPFMWNSFLKASMSEGKCFSSCVKTSLPSPRIPVWSWGGGYRSKTKRCSWFGWM